MKHELSAVLSDDCLSKRKLHLSQTTRTNAIKSGVDVLLDVARKTLAETTDDIYEYIEGLSKSLDLPLKLKYSPERCFYLHAQRSPVGLPESLIVQKTTKDMSHCTTLELLKLNQRIKESLEEVFLISDKLVAEMLTKCRERIGLFYEISEAIGNLDFLLSAAEYAQQNQTCNKTLCA